MAYILRDRIYINKSKEADTRSCDWTLVTKEQLIESTLKHKEDVALGIDLLISKLNEIKELHDITKLTLIDEFHSDFKTGFQQTSWWDIHKKMERHHLHEEDFIQEDVNLLDVLEQLVDAVMAAKARTNNFVKKDLPKGLLEKAYDNTLELMLGKVEVVG